MILFGNVSGTSLECLEQIWILWNPKESNRFQRNTKESKPRKCFQNVTKIDHSGSQRRPCGGACRMILFGNVSGTSLGASNDFGPFGIQRNPTDSKGIQRNPNRVKCFQNVAKEDHSGSQGRPCGGTRRMILFGKALGTSLGCREELQTLKGYLLEPVKLCTQVPIAA